MTREEEIKQAAKEVDVIADDILVEYVFNSGAKWADEHPSQELKEKFIDKAWEWIFRVFAITAPLDFQQAIEKEFRKEMREE